MLDKSEKPWWSVISPEDGESIWQPEPSQGYVTVKLSPQNMPYDTFSSGIQVLPPGCHVREHGHLQNHELIFIYEGNGICIIEEETYNINPGSTILFGRNARHIIENTGKVDMRLFWVFFPPGLEDWFRAIGRKRNLDESMPDKFSRPENVGDVMKWMKFLPPRE